MFEIDYNFLILCFINSKLIRILCKIIKKSKIDFKRFKRFDQNKFDFELINNETFFRRKTKSNFNQRCFENIRLKKFKKFD